jgi:hypothetical protein
MITMCTYFEYLHVWKNKYKDKRDMLLTESEAKHFEMENVYERKL